MMWANAGGLLSGTAAVFIGLIFSQSLTAKIADVAKFVGTIDAYRVLPRTASHMIAYGLITIEMVLILTLMVPPIRWVGALLAVSLLAGYAAAMAINLARGRDHIDCGCGGPAQPISSALVFRNIILAMIVSLLLFVTPSSLDLDEAILAGVSGVTLWLGLTVGEQLHANFVRLQKRRIRRFT